MSRIMAVTLRTGNLEKLSDFYFCLGIPLERRDGEGVVHHISSPQGPVFLDVNERQQLLSVDDAILVQVPSVREALNSLVKNGHINRSDVQIQKVPVVSASVFDSDGRPVFLIEGDG